MTLNIGGVSVGGDNPCRFVAEVSNNHNGSLERCLRLITAAKDAGADLIKVQCFTPDELVALRGDGPAPAQWSHMTMRELYSRAATPFDWFPVIAEYCADLEIPWFSSVFGPDSLALLESLNCPAYKIARLDNRQTLLGVQVCNTFKPLVVSSSGEDGQSVRGVLNLYCPEGYPQKDFKLGWPFKRRCEVAYDSPVEMDPWFDGFSYHGTDPFPCVIAATLGAKVIEAHLHLAEEPSELEANISTDQYTFAGMVATVKAMEAML